MNATSGLGATPDDVCHLVSLGLLESPTVAFQASDAAGTDAIFGATAAAERPSATLAFSPDGLPTLAAQAQYSKAYPIATRLTVGLGLRGFRLNLAVEAAGDLNKLKDLALRIKEAVGPEKFLELGNALYN